MTSSATEAFLTLLRTRPVVREEALAAALALHAERGGSLGALLTKLGLVSERDFAEHAAQFTGLERYDAGRRPEHPPPLEGVSPLFLRDRHLVPLNRRDEGLEAAVADPLDEVGLAGLAFAYGLPVVPCVATLSEVEHALDEFYPLEPDLLVGAPQDSASEQDYREEFEGLRELGGDAPVVRLVQRLVGQAVSQRASDIHFEPQARGLKVRFRLDGLLQEIETAPDEIKSSIISRLKIMAGLNIAERRLPQDGRIRLIVAGRETDFRVATTPTLHGESVVLRILDRQEVGLDFERLGFDADVIRALRQAISKPYGIVLVTGPTGSGKTTTLYAALKELNTPDRKLLTIEDPVEYTLAGVNQLPIKPQIGLDFANALRAFLRQDPDIMMVGEIRDRETAEIAVQAALTGHLILSTLHTNSAAAAVTRLLDMGIDDFLLTSTINAIVGQRLVRRLCLACRESYVLSSEAIARLQALDAAIRIPAELHRAKGCSECGGTGYQGRTTILEILEVSEAVRRLILARADASSIETGARSAGMRTMLEHGIEKAAAGVTTVEEVLRVTRSA